MPPSPPVDLDPECVRKACLDAADMISGMGYYGPHGSFHLLDLQLQANTVTAILHNLVAWRIGQIDPRWTFRPKGGATPDLTNVSGAGIQVKVTSDKKIKGNGVSSGLWLLRRYQVPSKGAEQRKHRVEGLISFRSVCVSSPLSPAPSGVTGGSLTENLNKYGVRLWTDRSSIR